MKRVFCIIFSCLLVITAASGAWAVVYGESGWKSEGYSEATAWEIPSAAVLAKVKFDINEGVVNRKGYYKLTNDIDITDELHWIPIGNHPERSFMGVFDGNGHKIKINMIIPGEDDRSIVGFFGYVWGGGTIKNLTVEGDINIYSHKHYTICVGGIASCLAEGSVENCKFDGHISGTFHTREYNNVSSPVYVGGIVGHAGDPDNDYYYWNHYESDCIFSIKNCSVGSQSSSSASITLNCVTGGPSYAGGILGYCHDQYNYKDGDDWYYDWRYKGRISEVSGNYSRVSMLADETGGIYGGRSGNTMTVENNLEGKPDEPEPDPVPVNDVVINSINFPDANFRSYVQYYFDENDNLVLSPSEIAEATEIDVYGGGISSLKGIEFFPALIYLDCRGNELASLDVSKNTKLVYLDCDANHLTELDLTKHPKLLWLDCSMNQLTQLDVSKNTKLMYLDCSNNRLTELNVSNNSKLMHMECRNNQLTKLDVSKNIAFSHLECENNQLTKLDVSKNIAFSHLECENNQLTALDVSKNTALMHLDCCDNQLTALDVSSCKNLTEFYSLRQVSPTLSYTKQSNGTYLVNLRNYVPDVSRVSNIESDKEYDNNNGILTFTEAPSIVGYEYDTRAVSDVSGNEHMDVNLTKKPEITTDSLPKATKGEEYSFELESYGSNITWTLENGTLPEGLSLSEGYGLIDGTPTESGDFTFTVKASNEYGEDSRDFTLKVNVSTPKITTSSLAKGTVGAKYSKALTAKATGADSFTWSISSGSLPDGLSLSETTGKISGTPTKAGKFTFTVNASANGASGNKEFSLTIAKAMTISGNLTDSAILQPYSTALKVTGGVSTYTWTKSKGNLPPGLAIDSQTGLVSGTPEEAGTYTFTVKVTDKNKATATKAYTVTITEPVISGTLSNGVIKAAYSAILSASGGTSPYTWSINSGTLPNGLTLNASTGKISGTPTKAGTYTFEVNVSDKNEATAVKSFTVKITSPAITGTLSNGIVKKSYSATLKASGGTSPYTWTKASGTLPTGLTLNKSTGKLSGTPSKAGKFTFTIKVTDKNGAEASKAYTVTITQINPTISGTFGGGVLKASYNYSISASEGTAPYKWKVSKGNLPNGLKLTYSGTKATISGTPSKAGTYLFTLALTDSNGGSASKAFVVVITSPAIYYSLRNGTIKASYSDYVTAYGGTAPYTWTVSKGNLPDGLKLSYSGSDATIKGTPTKAGKFTFTLTATDKNKVKTSREFTLTVTAPSISGTLKAGTVNQSYSGTLKASEGTASYTWTISKGSLPSGLTLNKSKGTITGKPTKAGKYSFTVKITDKNNATATKGYSITVEEASDAKKSTAKSSVVNVNEKAKTESRLSQNNTTEGTVVYVQPVNVSNNAASVYYLTSLEIVSEDVLSQGTGRDEDLVSVRANEPVRFIIVGIVNHESEFKVYINDEHEESLIVSDEGLFTLPAEFVRDDFKVQVKAGELESQELYISAIEQ